jgi:pimeloyl-ACP methyl ester carboxylesterase
MSTIEILQVSNGRRVSVHRLNDGGGRPVVFCHAAPGSGAFDPDPAVTARHDVTLLAPDRPGYGDADPVGAGEWASVASAADDVAAVLDERAIRGTGVVGWSAGGRVALALAARRPDLVERVAVVATPTPNEHLPWIPPEQMAGIDALRGLPPEQAHAAMTEQLAPTIPADPYSREAIAQLGASDADAADLDDTAARKRLGAMLEPAFRQGAAGMAQDIVGYCIAPWGFEPGGVTQPVLLVYGGADPIAAEPHARWWEQELPDARLTLVADAGHLVVIRSWDQILAFVAAAPVRA